MNTKTLLALALLGTSTLQAELFTELFTDGKTIKNRTNYVDGTRTDTSEGVKDGLEEVFYNSSELAYKVMNVKGKRDGALDWYDRDGKHLEIIHFKMGKRHGVNKLFYADGTLRSDVTYVDDKKEGVKKDYYSTGTLAREVVYKGDKKEGLEKEYHEDGKLFAESTYKNNYKEGEKRWFDKAGKVTRTVIYKMDRPINTMKKVQQKQVDATNVLLKGLDFNPNNRKVK